MRSIRLTLADDQEVDAMRFATTVVMDCRRPSRGPRSGKARRSASIGRRERCLGERRGFERGKRQFDDRGVAWVRTDEGRGRHASKKYGNVELFFQMRERKIDEPDFILLDESLPNLTASALG
jgi:hypothetical protein